MTNLYCRTTLNMESDEDDDEHVEEDSMMTPDSSLNLSQSNRKEEKLTPGKHKCMSKTVDPMKDTWIKF